MTPERRAARHKILEAANSFRKSRNDAYTPWYMRHIQLAVCCARRHQLVKPDVLTTAGYREVSR